MISSKNVSEILETDESYIQLGFQTEY